MADTNITLSNDLEKTVIDKSTKHVFYADISGSLFHLILKQTL